MSNANSSAATGDREASGQAAAPSGGTSGVGLTHHAARGFVWILMQTVGTKVVGFLGQIVLARLLLREDFGQVALVYTVTSFAGLLQQAGLRESLILRQKEFGRWSNPAFWMSFTLGTCAMAAMLAAAPVAARLYSDPALTGLVSVVSLAAPFASVSVIPASKLQVDLRFKAIALIAFMELSLQTTMSVILAAPPFRMGAYSFVIPVPIVAALRMGVMWWLARPPVGLRPEFSRWKTLYREGGLIFASYLLFTVVMQGDYVTLKLVSRSTEQVGVYYFAFVLSMQTVAVLSISLVNVLLPVLSQLKDDPPRQVKAFLRAIRVLAVVGIPPCLLQAALAEPLIRLFFGAKWLSAVPVLQVLSLGMAARIVAAPMHSMVKAQGRFRLYLWYATIYAAGFVPLAAAGAWAGGAVGTGVGVGVSLWVFELLGVYLAIRPGGGGWGDVARVCTGPTVCGLAAVMAGWAVAQALPQATGTVGLAARDVVSCLVVTGVGVAVYVPLIRRVAPAEWDEAIERLRPLLVRLRLGVLGDVLARRRTAS